MEEEKLKLFYKKIMEMSEIEINRKDNNEIIEEIRNNNMNTKFLIKLSIYKLKKNINIIKNYAFLIVDINQKISCCILGIQ